MLGVLIDQLWSGLLSVMTEGSDGFDFSFDYLFRELLWVGLFIPVVGPRFSPFEVCMTAICALLAFVFIRFELSARWLLVPLLLMFCGYVHHHTI